MVAYTFFESDLRVMRYADVLVKRGDKVDVIALRNGRNETFLNNEGVRIFRIQDRTTRERNKFSYLFRILKFLFSSGWLLAKLHLKHPYDLVHIHSVPDFLVFAGLLPKLLGAKIILDIHDILPEFYVSKFRLKKKGFLFKLLVLVERLSISFSNHVIISNVIWKEKLESRSVKQSKCTAIINYPDRFIFFVRKRTRQHNKFLMLYPGSINWHQGLDLALRALALIKDKSPHANLLIIGNGPYCDYLIDLKIKLGLNNRVFIRSRIPVKKIAKIMSNVDLGVIPKRDDEFGGEAFSTKSFEFMSCGIPIIVSRTKIDRFYFNETIVKFFEPENVEKFSDAMLEMINNKSLRDRLSANALEFVKMNSWNEKSTVYLKLVDTLCK